MTADEVAEFVALTQEVINRANAEAELLEYSALDGDELTRLRKKLDDVIASVTRFVAAEAAFAGGDLLRDRVHLVLQALVMATDTASDALQAIRTRNARAADVSARDLAIIQREGVDAVLDAMRALPFSRTVVRDFYVLDHACTAVAEQRLLSEAIARLVQRRS